jgi:hypothetical protein
MMMAMHVLGLVDTPWIMNLRLIQEKKDFMSFAFKSTQATNYPPGNMEILDVTQEAPVVMEKYFLNNNIEEILEAILNREV